MKKPDTNRFFDDWRMLNLVFGRLLQIEVHPLPDEDLKVLVTRRKKAISRDLRTQRAQQYFDEVTLPRIRAWEAEYPNKKYTIAQINRWWAQKQKQ